ncbi:hypothetical protein HGRIS_002542 [Hohenbuehelia grisea]|uniref:General transcription and DNA repair factor IIH subunit TFB4 n=1 Tax=Hohenbuehelia grisea TaxID=104357 RepID=A0ABR3JMQ7_9AGAR
MSTLLAVVLDLAPAQWHAAAKASTSPLPLATFIQHLNAFLNAHIAANNDNIIAVFAALPGTSVMLYPAAEPHVPVPDANSYTPFKLLDSAIIHGIERELDVIADSDNEVPVALVGALSKALCYINRLTIAQPTAKNEHALDPHILVLSVSPDLSSSYIPIMNAIFSAQKLKVTIDVCKIYGPETVFLQQAAHLTGGSYIYLERRDALLQYLTMSFLSAPALRKTLSVPTQDKIDFRVACFCHKNIVDIGFVCSVCLSIFCQPVPVCSTCKTRFPMKILQRLNAARPLLPSANSNGAARNSSPAGGRTNGNGNATRTR